MFKDVAFGQYYPANSVVHRLDPRLKLFATLLFVLGIFFVKSYFGFILTAALLLAIIVLAKLPILSVLKSVRGILLIVLLTSIINLFVIKDGEVLVSWKAIVITKNGVHSAIKIALRLVLLICGASLLSLTTTPVALADGLESLMSPLKILRVPVRDIAMIMSIALRFIPTLFEETNKIVNAQKARGAGFDSGNIFVKLKAMLSVLIPLFVNSFRRADELAFAMDARCYNASKKRTKLKKLRFGFADLIAFVLVAGYFVTVMLERYYFPTLGIDMDFLMFGGAV